MNKNESSNEKKIKVLIAKPGLDGHDRGAKVVIHALKEAGMDVLYTGLHNTVEEIVDTAEKENVDVIGMSVYSGAHLPLSKKLMDLLAKKGLRLSVLIGGNIPKRDIETMKSLGVKGVFPTGANLKKIVEFIKGSVTP
ncbi:MAG: cobalamin B12-binding domain-containing protein [Candidatus Aminicenantes bacterium]|nr:cobalamin B12-binding domain-containing protein [Candidatus Aminicenantes bacterium]